MQVQLTTTDGQHNTVDFFELLQEATYTVLYFYPKDNTSGCTLEAQEFTALIKQFQQAGVQIIGVSKDSHKSHCNFIDKHALKITLLSDSDLSLHHQFQTLGEKSMYGKKYMGTIRSTFLLDAQGQTLQERRNVSARGHAQQVLDYIQQMR